MKMRQFTEDFRQEAVRLALTSGRRQREIADDLGIGHSTLDRWISVRRGDAGAAAAAGETADEELKRLRRENSILLQERDILKKATAFFARETRG